METNIWSMPMKLFMKWFYLLCDKAEDMLYSMPYEPNVFRSGRKQK